MRMSTMFNAMLFTALLSAGPALAGSTTTSADAQQQALNAKCDAERKACYAGQTQTGSGGVRYVPPEAVRQCEAAFRMCTGQK